VCTAEGFSARIRVAGLVTPFLSALVVRRGQKEYRFDRVFEPWRARARINDLRWTVRLSGPHGRARLDMEANVPDTVCLGYRNPDGRLSHCTNSKLARARLQVNPVNEEGFECRSEHGGALEFLRNHADPRFSMV
jgi:hypothetical protein